MALKRRSDESFDEFESRKRRVRLQRNISFNPAGLGGGGGSSSQLDFELFIYCSTQPQIISDPVQIEDRGTGWWRVFSEDPVTFFRIDATDPDTADYTKQIVLSKSKSLTTLEGAFKDLTKLVKFTISKYNDFSNLTNMASMFQGCSSLTDLDTSYLMTANVTDMSNLFQGCISIESIVLRNFEFNSVNMNSMFSDCLSLKCITNIDTTTATDKSLMFFKTDNLERPNASEITDITDSNGADWVNDEYCPDIPVPPSKITDFDASDDVHQQIICTWSRATGNPNPTYDLVDATTNEVLVTNIDSPYQYVYEGTRYLAVEAVNPSGRVRSNADWGEGLPVQKTFEMTVFTINDIEPTFDSDGTIYVNKKDINEYEVISPDSITFINTTSSRDNIQHIHIHQGHTLTTYENLCKNMINLETFEMDFFDKSDITSMKSMFENCYNLTSIQVDDWNVVNTTTTARMFFNCDGFSGGSLEDMEFQSLKDCSSMFEHCTNLRYLSLKNSEMPVIESMQRMFADCALLTCITNIDTRPATDKTDMFLNCDNLTAPNTTEQNDLTDLNGANYVNPNSCPPQVDCSLSIGGSSGTEWIIDNNLINECILCKG